MHISRLAAGACAAAALTFAIPAAAVVVNVSGLNGDGTTVSLAAGTYEVTLAASDYSPWSFTSGCDSGGMNCSTGFTGTFAVDFGFGAGVFSHVDGFQFGQLAVPGDNRIYATSAQALAAFNAGPIASAPLPLALNPLAYSNLSGNYSFTLASAQAVNFFIFDTPYGDNRGGITLNLAFDAPGTPGVPEPATWAMMIMGFGAAGSMLRRRRTAAA